MASQTKEKTFNSRTDEILHLLEKADNWCSGEEISKQFDISRAAISKHIVSLRKYGHIIESATKKGYKLIYRNEKIDSKTLLKKLETKVFGKSEIFVFEKIGSSNQEAMLKALENSENGTLIIAENQEKGRGTKNHTWFSAPRSLQFSLLLRSQVCLQKTSIEINSIIESTLECIAQIIQELYGIKAIIKKPNDLLINNKKVCGVLVETGYRGEYLEWLILGVGINVNTVLEDFPLELQSICTSLAIESNNFFNRTDLLAHLLYKIEKTLQKSQVL